MYLKSIEIQGFKSFANKTLFEFHNGITCIVGPNGSGKSNVADAVRWVLGEQSAKQLRGSNMQDVIFSGTENRRPQGYASVSIIFDNSDRQLNIDYNEVTVARRVYRSGESEYLLNGTLCRLKDVSELFYDTGIGKEGYSIIGQGQIDKILSSKPEERRELFDEAAGIVKYKRRKAVAQKRLESEQANMVRLSDIMAELEKQVGPLERQSRAAREYLSLKEELKKYDIDAFAMESLKLEKSLEEIEHNLSIAQKDYEEADISSKELKEKYEKQQEKLAQLENDIASLRDEASAYLAEKQDAQGNVKLLDEQIKVQKLQKEHNTARLKAIAEERESCEAQIKDARESIEGCADSMQEIKLEENEINLEITRIQGNIEAFRQELKAKQSEMISLLNEKTSYVGELQKYETLRNQAKAELASLNTRLIQSRTDESVWKKREGECRSDYEAAVKSREELTAIKETLQSRYEKKQEAAEKLTSDFYEKSRLHQVTVTREESLKNLAERYEGYGSSIRHVMERKKKTPGIHGVVADLIHVDKKYEIAVETALGGSIQNIVTDTEDTAKQLIDFLKKNKLGRATFLPLNAIAVRDEFSQPQVLKEKGIVGLASSLVKTEEKYRKLARFLLGRIVVADTIDNGLAVSAKYNRSLRIVTLEGELLNPGGSMTGGAFKNTSNLLGRNRELEELSLKLAKEKKELEALSLKCEEEKKELEEINSRSEQLKEELNQAALKETEGRLGLNEASHRLEEIYENRNQWINEQKLQEDKVRSIESECIRMKNSINSLDKAGDKSQSSADENQENADREIKTRDLLLDKLQQQRLRYSGLEQKKEFLNQDIVRLEADIKGQAEEKDAIIRSDAACDMAVKEKNEEIKAKEALIKELTDKLKANDTEVSELIVEKTSVNNALKSFFGRQEEISKRMSILDKEIFRLNHQKEAQEEKLDDMTEYLWSEYELRPSDARRISQSSTLSLGEIKSNITRIRNAVRELGNVNVNAIEEYREVSQRYEFMKTQYDDLTESEKSLRGVILELDTGMRKQFTEKFAQIQEEFDKVFKELFGGGNGRVELVEDEDVIEAGIRIISQPPGKKLQNMMQLSGGEKALTAIALMFAIQNLKPSPFCLLDEIEAALDDSNVGRFAAYLHKLTENTQFIVITHRRGTMTSADRLYGITMQEKGVSALVSVNLIEQQLDT